MIATYFCILFRPNLVENHLALLLSAWIGAGILEVNAFILSSIMRIF
jgi:hypothetical protein